MSRKPYKMRRGVREDDYDWGRYPSLYNQKLVDLENTYTLVLSDENHVYVDNELYIEKGCLQIHPQHKLLYEMILKLAPKDLHEIGCGRGNHLSNISMLSNGKIQVYGSDISEEQIVSLKTDHLSLIPFVGCVDIVKNSVPPVDCIVSSAVLMHLSDVNCGKAILNICMSARKTIVLQENFQRRNYETFFKRIQPPGWEFAKIERTHTTFLNQEDDASVLVIKKLNESPTHIS